MFNPRLVDGHAGRQTNTDGQHAERPSIKTKNLTDDPTEEPLVQIRLGGNSRDKTKNDQSKHTNRQSAPTQAGGQTHRTQCQQRPHIDRTDGSTNTKGWKRILIITY